MRVDELERRARPRLRRQPLGRQHADPGSPVRHRGRVLLRIRLQDPLLEQLLVAFPYGLLVRGTPSPAPLAPVDRVLVLGAELVVEVVRRPGDLAFPRARELLVALELQKSGSSSCAGSPRKRETRQRTMSILASSSSRSWGFSAMSSMVASVSRTRGRVSSAAASLEALRLLRERSRRSSPYPSPPTSASRVRASSACQRRLFCSGPSLDELSLIHI